MKYAKKIMAACAATALLATMATTSVFAATTVDDVDTESTQTTKVTYSVTAGYTWTVPAEVDFGSNKGVNNSNVTGSVKNSGASTVTVNNNVIEEGKMVHITAAGSGDNGAFTIKNGTSGTEVLGYKVTVDNSEISAKGTVLDVKAGTESGSATLGFTLTTTNKTAEIAGSYSGEITYTASVVAQSSN